MSAAHTVWKAGHAYLAQAQADGAQHSVGQAGKHARRLQHMCRAAHAEVEHQRCIRAALLKTLEQLRLAAFQRLERDCSTAHAASGTRILLACRACTHSV